MYIFISHSSLDKEFVRRMTDSLAFYGIPVFLDERVIRVGDDITKTIFDALDRCDHVIYVLSSNSINSKWVNEELSVAKQKQLSVSGCKILPVIIDDVSPPSSVAHIKYADFRNWKVKEAYLSALHQLLEALGVDLQSYTSSSELRFYHKYLIELARIKTLADIIAQVYFQLERLWFGHFNRDSNLLSWWFQETTSKTWNIAEFDNTYRSLESAYSREGSEGESIIRLLQLCKDVRSDYMYLSNMPRGDDDESIYQRIWRSENRARELSAVLYSMILEIHGVALVKG